MCQCFNKKKSILTTSAFLLGLCVCFYILVCYELEHTLTHGDSGCPILRVKTYRLIIKFWGGVKLKVRVRHVVVMVEGLGNALCQ